jgi:hypothetical protein
MTTSNTTVSTTLTTEVCKPVHVRRWWTVLGAMAAAVATWTILDPLLNIDLALKAGDGSTQQVTQLATTLVSLFAGLAAWGTLALLERYTDRARTIWTTVAVLFLLISLLGPLGAVSTGATVGLLALHVVVGGILIVGLGRTARRR